eukprot:COSAG01_NODE_228_length_21104_cov_210.303832_20_plen_56_part_00
MILRHLPVMSAPHSAQAVNSVVGPLCRAQCYEATDIFSNGWLTLTKEILHKVSQM